MLKKSRFCLRELKYLGYIVGTDGLRVDDDKITAILDLPIPKNVKQVRRFIGVSGWYRRFIANYSTLAAPLTGLLKKGTKFNWNPEADKAFNELKRALTTAPTLATPNFNKHFYIQCDASKVGVGSVLFQLSEDGEEHPLAFFSQKLNKAQKNYSVTELECLAAVSSIMKFRAYVEGLPFTVITDHASLKWLMEQRDLSGRLARWSLKLQSFNFTVEHRKGSQNIVPDALSRVHQDAVEGLDALSLEDTEVPPLGIRFDDDAFQDEEYRRNLDILRNRNDIETNTKIVNERIYLNTSPSHQYTDSDLSPWKLVVPAPLTAELILRAHNSPTGAHLGIHKTIEILKRHFYWPKLSKDVTIHIKNCDTCKTSKACNQSMRSLMGGYYEITRPWAKIYVDFLGPYPRSKNGNTMILIILDHYSKFVVIKPIKQATSQILVRYLKQDVFNLFGAPQFLMSDNGRQFESHVLSEFLERYGVTHIFTPRYSPQANASERVNRTILAAVRSYLRNSHQDWDQHIDDISCALRNVCHESTGYSPYFMVFGQHMVLHASAYKIFEDLSVISNSDLYHNKANETQTNIREKVLQNLRRAYTKHENNYNWLARFREFQVGQQIFVRNFAKSSAIEKFSEKLKPKFLKGVVSKRIGNVSYEIKDLDGKIMGTYHAKDMKD